MPLTTKQPTSNTTPDAGQGGIAVTTPSNTGHASTSSAALDVSDSQLKTCIWSGFTSVGGQKVTVTLKIDHTSSGALTGIGANNAFKLEYSLNNGSSWTTAVSRSHFTAAQGPTTFSQALSIGQDLTQVKVRDSILATTVSGGESSGCTATIANIKIEVVTVGGAPILIL